MADPVGCMLKCITAALFANVNALKVFNFIDSCKTEDQEFITSGPQQ
jgi:hypothetical protein